MHIALGIQLNKLTLLMILLRYEVKVLVISLDACKILKKSKLDIQLLGKLTINYDCVLILFSTVLHYLPGSFLSISLKGSKKILMLCFKFKSNINKSVKPAIIELQPFVMFSVLHKVLKYSRFKIS